MKYAYSFLIAAILFAGCQQDTAPRQGKWTYPATAKVEQVDTYFGHEVADPYRWLEDDRSEETATWVKDQNELTFSYLESIPYREKIKKRLEELENYEKVSAPFPKGDYYYFYKNDGLQNQSVLYRKKGLEGEAEVFFDPNTLSEDGTVALAGSSFSKDGRYFAYMLSESGSDWRSIYVMDAQSMQKLDDHLRWAKFTGIAWQGDGFYYQRFPEPRPGDELKAQNTFGKIYYHRLGSSQEEDELIFENPQNPNNRFGAQVTDDERFLVIYSTETTHGNGLYLKDLSQPGSEFVPVITDFEHEHRVIGNEGSNIFLLTNLQAPNQRVVKVAISSPTPEHWEDVIPESEHALSAAMAGGRIFASYLKDAKTAVYQYKTDGSLEWEIKLPDIGTASGFSGEPEQQELFYSFASFTIPSAVYRYDIATGVSTLYQQARVAFNPADYHTEQVFYHSKDGTRVPMFIVYKKGLKKNGQNPCWLYAYGGFNISVLPRFSASRIAWLEQGGIYAQPNIRGGGEYGEEWHKAGTKMQKQNVFDDFIAAAEYLIEEGYTSSEYLAIEGGSNGGLLIGATINQRPELAKVAIPRVGVMDMLRYQHFTIGSAWRTDYGTSEDSEEMFEYLRSYSPLHNIREDAPYPATLVMTADHDDRVVPAHSFKYAATLQEKAGWGPNPLLIRIETKAGHGGGTPTYKRIEQRADMYAFALENMGLEYVEVPDVARTDW